MVKFARIRRRDPALRMLLFAAFLLGACTPSGDEAPAARAPAAVTDEPAGDRVDEPAEAPPAESPARAVVSDRLPYAEVGNELVYGHFVFPSDMVEPLPAVILIHEWWGLTDRVRAAADRLAGQGFIVLAVDLMDGKTTDDVAAARSLMLQVVNDPGATTENLRQALEFVTATAGAPAVATLGWGLGGSWSLNAAMLFPDQLRAAVIFYGQVSDEPSRLDTIKAPVLGFFGAADRTVPVSDVEAFELMMQDLGKALDVTVFPGAGHGFANPEGRNYDAGLAERSWQETLVFLEATLYSDSP
jgi:carboxymethylenebutenolidase